MRLFLLIILFFSGAVLYGQPVDENGYEYARHLNADSIKAHLSVLASAEYEGRETGELGQKLAARYLADELKNMGIQGGGDSLEYFQKYDLYSPPIGQSSMTIGKRSFIDLKDYYSFTPLCDTLVEWENLVFLGYGISRPDYDNYKGVQVKGKMGVIFRGEPKGSQTEWGSNFSLKSKLAKVRGLKGLIVIDSDFDKKLIRAKHYVKKNKLRFKKPDNTRFPIVHIGANTLFKLYPGKSKKAIESGLLTNQWKWDLPDVNAGLVHYKGFPKHVVAENVIGWIPGTKSPDEYVFITAHYDHLGIRGEDISYGADDNGSGTSALLEIARVFKEADKERNGLGRSVVFLFVSGEEKGLLGSSYYVDHPLFPLAQTVTDLNIDMIGRRDTEHMNDSSKYLYVIGSDKLSSDLHTISEETNRKHCNFSFDYRFNDPDDPMRLYYRSDHYNFAKYGIPVIFYFRGLHDDYHKPSDTIDKIDFDSVVEISQLVFLTAWNIGNRSERLVVDSSED